MSGMVKFHVEAFDKARREFLNRRRNGVHIGMTYRAHRLLFGICELTDVTADARVVSGIFEIERLTFATMTRSAFELFVFRYLMRERLKCSVGRADGDRLRSFGSRDRHRNFILLPNATHPKRSKRTEDDEGFEESFSWRLSHWIRGSSKWALC